MKKIISVLLLALTLTVFSSCIIVGDPDIFTTNYYDITCYNVSDTRITDWCVVRNGNRTFAKSEDECCPIAPNGGSATLRHLPEGKYTVYVAFVNSPNYDDGDYVASKTFDLTEDFPVYIDKTFVNEYLKRK